ncbi:MAG: hypothetical protein HC810_08475 [Acaryochloridaceae cyanobacterium RL_2_7]|nr:hypothetical protein [Acaryochloridaceae cyanobacterium RL_2_7]
MLNHLHHLPPIAQGGQVSHLLQSLGSFSPLKLSCPRRVKWPRASSPTRLGRLH